MGEKRKEGISSTFRILVEITERMERPFIEMRRFAVGAKHPFSTCKFCHISVLHSGGNIKEAAKYMVQSAVQMSN